ncbi:hypothetical protein C2G38_2230365 [Gigaspora rosea]|uniref:FAR1 domain-containing protein n=1 Tax=Gigaspora rosea TaxID=44941 RepID=A0A397TYS2_9GLOM|nr:hypothetical protein C2G38_2230365 [Gigaspora rosea]
MECEVSFDYTEEDSVNIVNELAVGQSIGSWNEFDHIELHNEDWINIMNELAFGRTVESWNELDLIELYNEDSTNIIDEPAIRQMVSSQNELDCIELHNEGLTDERTINRIESHNENSANAMDEPAVGKIFGSWDEIDGFISFYAKSQNFVSVIRGSEYSNGICKSRRYACEHQGYNGTNNTGIAENQRQTILKINSVCLDHNDHQIKDETNKFALKYRTFSEDMLNDIKFWTEIGNINMRTQYQMLVKQYPDVFFLPQDLSNVIQSFKQQNHVECKAATLLNDFLERKSKDNRWIINWKIDPANNSLTSLFWISPDQYDLYIRY